MKQIIVTILYTPETGQVGMTLGATDGGSVVYREVALALIKALESVTVGLPDQDEWASVVEEQG